MKELKGPISTLAFSAALSLALALAPALTVIPAVTMTWGAAFAQQLKAIDPSMLQLDETPSHSSAGSSSSGTFNSTPIQGRPLGSTFQPMNQSPQSGMLQPDQGAGFGQTMSPSTDEPASAQDEERVNNLEQKAFGCSYHEHEVPDRLDHLEKEIFGAPRQGPIKDRISKLEVKLLGGTGFGAASSSVAQRPSSSPTSGGSRGSGSSAGAGDGWLTQPAGTPAQMPPPMQTKPGQSDWQVPSGDSYPPMQMVQASPPQQLPAQMQPPAQQMQQAPQQSRPLPPAQQQKQPGQQRPPQQHQQTMPAQQQLSMQPPQQQISPPPRQQMPPQQMQQAQQPYQPMQPMPPSGQQYGQPSQGFARQPGRGAPPSNGLGLTADASLVANSLFYDVKAGDYLAAIRRFPGVNGQPGQTYAHWLSFPVRLRMPKETPDSWLRSLEAVVARWDQYVPVKLALPLEAAPVEVQWVNQLPPKTLGVTRLMIAHGEMRVIIYLLRPSFYPPEVPERALAGIFMHEVGHALGIFGHSDRTTDLMYPAEIQPAGHGKPAQIHFAPVSTRDINTIKKIYESPAVPPTISLEQPLEWALVEGERQPKQK